MIAFFKTVKKGWIKNQVKGIVEIMLQIFFSRPGINIFSHPRTGKETIFEVDLACVLQI